MFAGVSSLNSCKVSAAKAGVIKPLFFISGSLSSLRFNCLSDPRKCWYQEVTLNCSFVYRITSQALSGFKWIIGAIDVEFLSIWCEYDWLIKKEYCLGPVQGIEVGIGG